MARRSLYNLEEKPIKIKVPVVVCTEGHLHVPVGKNKECLVCKYDKKITK